MGSGHEPHFNGEKRGRPMVTERATVNHMMEAYALDAVDHAKQACNRDLDFSPASVQQVEEILRELFEAKPQGFLRRLFTRGFSRQLVWTFAKMYGGYVGEVLRKSGGGEWFFDESFKPGQRTMDLQTIGLWKGDHRIWPPAKVWQRLTNGSEDNVWHYFSIIVADW
jgi:hypothetical protein